MLNKHYKVLLISPKEFSSQVSNVPPSSEIQLATNEVEVQNALSPTVDLIIFDRLNSVVTFDAVVNLLEERNLDIPIFSPPRTLAKQELEHPVSEIGDLTLKDHHGSSPIRQDQELVNLRALMGGATELLCVLDSSCRVVSFNHAFQSRLGWSQEELTGRSIFEILYRNANCKSRPVAEHFERIHNIKGSTGKFDDLWVSRDGRRRIPVTASMSWVPNDKCDDGIILIAEDMSDLRRAHQNITLLQSQIATERRNLESVINQMPIGVMIIEGQTGRIVVYNDTAQQMLGERAMTSTCLENSPLLSVFKADGSKYPPEETPVIRAVCQGETVKGEVIRVKSDGRYYYYAMNAGPLLNSQGQQVAALIALFDITRERETQQELVEARNQAEQATRAKSAFLANMSHEIRTPLGAVMGFTELLRGQGVSEAEREEFLEIIYRNGQSLLHLIDDILDLSKVEAGHLKVDMAEHDLSGVLDDVASLLGPRAASKGLELIMREVGPTPGRVVTDPDRLKQILVNLVGNAIRFTDQGQIELEVSTEDHGYAGSKLLFRVKDSGRGISLEQQKRLFQPFCQGDNSTTREFGGTGLGLALSKSLARLLGGHIWLEESILGQGSTFAVSLNLQTSESAHHENAKSVKRRSK